MKSVVAIAMSGGIDSLVSAYLLKREGFPVFGLHFITGFEPPAPEGRPDVPTALSERIGIPVHAVDLREAFRTAVVDYFVRTYRQGKTPNPCLVCNPAIKFDALLKVALQMGADRLATGHYARVGSGTHGRFHLYRGADARKDQSYFLAFLSQDQLARAVFPLGGMHKSNVRALARAKGLDPIFRNESVDVCFIRGRSYHDFLVDYAGLTPKPGPVVTPQGITVGRHYGLHRFTVGQRRGINIPSSEPYYVLRLEPETNTLVVGRKAELAASQCRVTDVNWIGDPPELPATVAVRLRYRHRAVPATLIGVGANGVKVRFHSPQQGPTPGQGAVFYMEDRVAGAGIIAT